MGLHSRFFSVRGALKKSQKRSVHFGHTLLLLRLTPWSANAPIQ
jgi:hypothetical protein